MNQRFAKDKPEADRRRVATAIRVLGQFDCGRIAGLNRVAVGTYSQLGGSPPEMIAKMLLAELVRGGR